MDINHLKEFAYLAQTLSFKRTAEHFYVSRSVISRHLAGLEEEIGARLVDRSGNGVSLTELGEVFLREAKVVLRDYERALDRVNDARANGARTVHVGYLRNAARPVLVHFVRAFSAANPQLRLMLTCMEYGELRRAMDDGTVDVALAVNVDPAVSRNYRSTHLYTDRYFAVMGKDHPLARADAVLLDDLPAEKLLLPDSFVYAGLSDIIDGVVESHSRNVAQSYYRDVDMLYLKVQTEGYVALSGGMNNAMFGDQLAVVPLAGVDSTFQVSAFYSDDIPAGLYAACRDAFEACRDGACADIRVAFPAPAAADGSEE